MAKRCNTCNIEQDQSQFYKDSSLPSGLKHKCKTCTRSYNLEIYKSTGSKRKAQTTAWKLRNPDYVKNNSLETKYGVTLETYKTMFEKQDGKCAICSKPQNENLKGRMLALDHNHANGQVRGLLCYKCNMAIGLLKDSKSNALKLVEYLELYEKTPAV
jgi:hypothetical protein